MDADVDALARAARNARGGEEELWRAVVGLSAWYFIAQGESREPMVISVEGWPRLLAFTRRDRAEAFAKGIEECQGLARPDVLEMSASEALDHAGELESYDVESILFNPGINGFSCDIASLRSVERPSRRLP